MLCIEPIHPRNVPELATFLEEFVDDPWFHPHPMTAAYAKLIGKHAIGPSQDVYLGVFWERRCVAYGMLRGWDEGWEVPSLGIAVKGTLRGYGIGRMLMYALHTCARLREAPAIRLKVFPENLRAKALYKSLGYELQGIEADGQELYLLNLHD